MTAIKRNNVSWTVADNVGVALFSLISTTKSGRHFTTRPLGTLSILQLICNVKTQNCAHTEPEFSFCACEADKMTSKLTYFCTMTSFDVTPTPCRAKAVRSDNTIVLYVLRPFKRYMICQARLDPLACGLP
jgi:hypothetical protein